MADGAVQIEINKKQWRQLQLMLKGVPGGMGRVLSRAINDTTRHLRIRVAEELAAVLDFRLSEVKRGVVITERATMRHWQGRVSITGKRVPLIAFQAKQAARGVRYKIGSGARKLLAGAFIATMPGGHKGVFMRKGTARLPISERFGPSIMAVLDQGEGQEIGERISEETAGLLEQNVARQVEYVLQRHRGRLAAAG